MNLLYSLAMYRANQAQGGTMDIGHCVLGAVLLILVAANAFFWFWLLPKARETSFRRGTQAGMTEEHLYPGDYFIHHVIKRGREHAICVITHNRSKSKKWHQLLAMSIPTVKEKFFYRWDDKRWTEIGKAPPRRR